MFLTIEYFERVQSGKFELLNLRDFKPSQYPIRRIYVQQWRLALMRKAKDLGKSVVTLAGIDKHRIAQEEIYLHSNWKLSYKMLPNLIDVREQTPLLHTAEGGHKEVIKLLVAQSDNETNLKDEDGQTPLS